MKKNNKSKGKFTRKAGDGKKIRSIYSPGWTGKRVPTGAPGDHKPLLHGDALRDLLK